MSNYALAQLNIARMREPIDSPTLADFVANLERINALAEQSPGYIWRLQSDAGDATAFRPFGDDMLVNMSLWKDIESLHNYVYKSAHIEIMRRRKEWFKQIREVYSVLWWTPGVVIPTLDQARAKLALLQRRGPTAEAFTFKQPFAVPSEVESSQLAGFDDTCPAT